MSMNGGSSGRMIALSWAICMMAMAGRATGAPYILTDLGTLGGDSVATGINDAGQIVGWSYVGNSLRQHAFRTAPHGLINAAADLGTLTGTNSIATGINAAGQVVG